MLGQIVTGCAVVAIVLGLASGAAAQHSAPPTTEPATASISVLSPSSTTLTWNAAFDTTRAIPLCLSSSTGRYDLSVSTTLVSKPIGTATVGLNVDFQDQAGVRHLQSVVGQRIDIDGTVARDLVCAGQTAANLIVSLNRAQALAGVAGDYAYALELSIAPR